MKESGECNFSGMLGKATFGGQRKTPTADAIGVDEINFGRP